MPPSDTPADHSLVETGAIDTQSTSTATSDQPAPGAPPVSYSRFAVPLTVAVFSVPAMLFSLADNLARRHFSSGMLVASFAVVTVISLVMAVRERARLRSTAQTSPEVSENIRKIEKIALIFALLFGASTFLIGYFAGVSGSETKMFMSHLSKRRELGIRISAIRQRAGEDIPAQIQMYKSISGEVEELDALIRQLRAEFAIYEAKYRVKDEEKKSIVQSFDTDAAWLGIMKKEIALAKELDKMQEAARSEHWTSDMVPLLIQEEFAARTK